MHIRTRRGWEIPESLATPEDMFVNRRTLIKGLAAGSILAASPPFAAALSTGAAAAEGDPTADLYPAPRNLRYTLDREITPEEITGKYNNFYEFGSHKQIHQAAQRLETRPWAVVIDGLVEKQMTVDIDDLIRRMSLEERLYRHRCVEAWSMAIPWTGFPMKDFVDFARPSSGARYVVMETFMDPKVAPGQRQFWYPWPYVEVLTIEEATNELAFLVTGAYGKPTAKQFGAPLRLAVPWKYGFKSIKSIVRVSFSDQRPKSFWEQLAGNEYGFWANVNPAVPHPRWSQATERFLTTGDRIPTQIYNGYGEFVADLYTGMDGERLFM
ncbi:MAG: protein-methionine-sulfoxide reductase catalytic subunit MsrP [Proteobacteria bacterium]|nr:protein-methionine-sulfoxide reductase catalytic subunit MsrP [Pseudomonadota bacterium]